MDFIKNRLTHEERAIGKYKNRYAGNPVLAGVEVYQKPFAENTVEDYRDYIGADKHPGTINYHFWDGRVLETDYSPKGKCLRSDWTSHTVYEAPGYYRSWEMVDFSKGSDPEFKHHKDPRKEPMRSLYPPSTP